jgi:hypothetical protein
MLTPGFSESQKELVRTRCGSGGLISGETLSLGYPFRNFNHPLPQVVPTNLKLET